MKVISDEKYRKEVMMLNVCNRFFYSKAKKESDYLLHMYSDKNTPPLCFLVKIFLIGLLSIHEILYVLRS